MRLFIPFWIFGLAVLASAALTFYLASTDEIDTYCDHEYDSYCPKCGLDS